MTRKLLLRLYPASWRKEYGPEFAALLDARPLTPRVAVNVAAGALWQHLRRPSSWVPIAALLLCFTMARIVLQAFGIMSPQFDQDVLGDVWNPLVVLGGLWLATRKDATFLSAFAGALAAATIGKMIPALVLVPLSRPDARLATTFVFFLHVLQAASVMAACGALLGSLVRRMRGIKPHTGQTVA